MRAKDNASASVPKRQVVPGGPLADHAWRKRHSVSG
jgi:hypothetical protein